MSGHSKGPWEITTVPIQSQGGSNLCHQIGPMVACIYDDWRARERGISEQENRANARLMAAAPEMYEALRALLYDIDCLPDAIKAFLAWEHIKAGEDAIELAEELQEPRREGK